jgi:hypothetical protein
MNDNLDPSKMTEPAEQDAATADVVAGQTPDKRRRVPAWAVLVIVALVAVLIAAPLSVAVYVLHQHRVQSQQLALGAWWQPVSTQLEHCSTDVTNIKTSVGQGVGTQVVTSAQALQKCLDGVPVAVAPDDTVQLAMATAMAALNAAAKQANRLGTLMGDKPVDLSQPDQLAAYVALTEQFAVTEFTLLSLEQVVRQAAGQTTGPLPTVGP